MFPEPPPPPVFRLRIWPDPVLSVRCQPVTTDFDYPELRQAIEVMLETVTEHNALGIAANQIGYTGRVIVARIAGKLAVMINPRILERRGAYRVHLGESCVSVPGVVVPVTRASSITVSYSDGLLHTVCGFSGLEAAIIQHEIDHLDGKTLADHPHAKRGPNRRILDELKAKA